MTSREIDRTRFDRLLEGVIECLPGHLRQLLEHTPVVVDDQPSVQLCAELEIDDPEELCGLYTGVALTERSVEHAELPDVIQLFRRGVLAAAGGWAAGEAAVREQIRITLLHEIGHHFGLDEPDLDELGYG